MMNESQWTTCCSTSRTSSLAGLSCFVLFRSLFSIRFYNNKQSKWNLKWNVKWCNMVYYDLSYDISLFLLRLCDSRLLFSSLVPLLSTPWYGQLLPAGFTKRPWICLILFCLSNTSYFVFSLPLLFSHGCPDLSILALWSEPSDGVILYFAIVLYSFLLHLLHLSSRFLLRFSTTTCFFSRNCSPHILKPELEFCQS